MGHSKHGAVKIIVQSGVKLGQPKYVQPNQYRESPAGRERFAEQAPKYRQPRIERFAQLSARLSPAEVDARLARLMIRL